MGKKRDGCEGDRKEEKSADRRDTDGVRLY